MHEVVVGCCPRTVRQQEAHGNEPGMAGAAISLDKLFFLTDCFQGCETTHFAVETFEDLAALRTLELDQVRKKTGHVLT